MLLNSSCLRLPPLVAYIKNDSGLQYNCVENGDEGNNYCGTKINRTDNVILMNKYADSAQGFCSKG